MNDNENKKFNLNIERMKMNESLDQDKPSKFSKLLSTIKNKKNNSQPIKKDNNFKFEDFDYESKISPSNNDLPSKDMQDSFHYNFDNISENSVLLSNRLSQRNPRQSHENTNKKLSEISIQNIGILIELNNSNHSLDRSSDKNKNGWYLSSEEFNKNANKIIQLITSNNSSKFYNDMNQENEIEKLAQYQTYLHDEMYLTLKDNSKKQLSQFKEFVEEIVSRVNDLTDIIDVNSNSFIAKKDIFKSDDNGNQYIDDIFIIDFIDTLIKKIEENQKNDKIRDKLDDINNKSAEHIDMSNTKQYEQILSYSELKNCKSSMERLFDNVHVPNENQQNEDLSIVISDHMDDNIVRFKQEQIHNYVLQSELFSELNDSQINKNYDINFRDSDEKKNLDNSMTKVSSYKEKDPNTLYKHTSIQNDYLTRADFDETKFYLKNKMFLYETNIMINNMENIRYKISQSKLDNTDVSSSIIDKIYESVGKRQMAEPMEFIIKQDIDISHKYTYKLTLLQLMLISCVEMAFQILWCRRNIRFNLNDKDSDGQTPLQRAVMAGHEGLVQILIYFFNCEYNVLINEPIPDGEEVKKDTRDPDKFGVSLLVIAVVNEHFEIANFLQEKGFQRKTDNDIVQLNKQSDKYLEKYKNISIDKVKFQRDKLVNQDHDRHNKTFVRV